MNFRTLLFTILLATATRGLHAQNDDFSNVWRATIKVVDESGAPVAGADVIAGYFVAPPPGESTAKESIKGVTDSAGLFTASHRDRSSTLGFRAQKEDYYPTDRDYSLGYPTEYNAVKWSPSLTLVLRRIGQPIPMYAKRIHGGPPTLREPVGYDLTIGDWIGPYGKGQRGDITFTREFTDKSPYDYESKLTISFPNPGDGIQEIIRQEPIHEGSFLKSPHEAPTGGYQPQLLKEEGAHPGQERKEPDNNPNRIYLIRVQTFFDQNGHVKSALYGKIYGDFMEFSYYLNPTPNSLNLEFDPQQNLLKNLKDIDQVKAP
jgi:hypothetical protein